MKNRYIICGCIAATIAAIGAVSPAVADETSPILDRNPAALDLDSCLPTICTRWVGACKSFETPTFTVCPASAEHKVVVLPPVLNEDGTTDGHMTFTFFAGKREISFNTEPSTISGLSVVTRFEDTLYEERVEEFHFAAEDISRIPGAVEGQPFRATVNTASEWQEGDARGSCDYRGSQIRCEVTGLKTESCLQRYNHSKCTPSFGAQYVIAYHLINPAPVHPIKLKHYEAEEIK